MVAPTNGSVDVSIIPTVLRALLVVVLAAGLIFVGRMSALPDEAQAKAARALDPEGLSHDSSPEPAASALDIRGLVRAIAQAPASSEATERTETERRDSAAFLTDKLLTMLQGVSKRPYMEHPETRANALRSYVIGLADGIREGDPQLVDALTAEVTDKLCGQNLPDDQIILLSYLSLEVPDIVTSDGFDCFFSRALGKEDEPLWYMLDAWRHSRQEKTAVLSEIERTATDPRTQDRFRSTEDEVAMVNRLAADAEGVHMLEGASQRHGEASPSEPVVQVVPDRGAR